jgi:hypothetical protein
VTLNLTSQQAFAAAKAAIGNGIVKTDASGIGDDAVYLSAHGSPTALTVQKGAAPNQRKNQVNIARIYNRLR